MPIPWAAIAGVGSILAPLLFGGGGSEQKQVTETEIPPAGYQSPMLPLADPMILQMLLQNMQSWGGPAGPKGTTGAAYTPMIQDLMKLIGSEWPKLMGGVQSPGFTNVARGPLGRRRRGPRGSSAGNFLARTTGGG